MHTDLASYPCEEAPGSEPGEGLGIARSSLALRYAELSRLLSPLPAPTVAGIRRLLADASLSPMSANVAEMLRAGDRAAKWCEQVADTFSLEAENGRLYGMGAGNRIPLVSPCAAVYVASNPEEMKVAVSEAYARASFSPDLPEGTCVCNIAAEVAFLSHCLSSADGGLIQIADAFFMEHLFSWAIVFTSALTAVSTHPVTQFAARSLDDTLYSHWGGCI